MFAIRVIEGKLNLFPDGRAIVGPGGLIEIGESTEKQIAVLEFSFSEKGNGNGSPPAEPRKKSVTYAPDNLAKLRERHDISAVADAAGEDEA